MSPTVQNPPRKRPLPPLVLWLGVLIADWCIMAPVLLIGAMMASGWVGGSSHPENFWRIVIPSLAVLSVLSVLVLFVWRHFRWLYWIGLGGHFDCFLGECKRVVSLDVASYRRMRHRSYSCCDWPFSLRSFGGVHSFFKS